MFRHQEKKNKCWELNPQSGQERERGKRKSPGYQWVCTHKGEEREERKKERRKEEGVWVSEVLEPTKEKKEKRERRKEVGISGT